MRKLSENFANPGNSLGQGLMNHYTPIDNIIINVRNIFGALLGLVVSKGEDGVSLKIQSSTFVDPEQTRNILYNSTFDGRTYLANYISNQGLNDVKIINVGQSCIAYFCPSDLAQSGSCSTCKCKEMKESQLVECEMSGIIKEDYEEELEDKTKEELNSIINNQNKVKASNDFAEKLRSVIELPDDLYIKATKDIDGHESIALRYKTEQRRPFGGKTDVITSLMNIYATGTNAIWVGAFLNKDIYTDEIINTVNTILQFVGAQETDDECVWDIPDSNTNDGDDNKSPINEPDGPELNIDDEDDNND